MVIDARYHRAAEDARSIPNDLLSSAQRLKLYALFKQAESPAPEKPPSKGNAVAYSKWEAWNDVRPLSKQQAMESYCAIIEGLMSLTRGQLSLPAESTVAADAPAADEPEAAPAAAEDEAPPPAEAPPAEPSGPPEPAVDCQQWATSSLSLAPGAIFEIPMAVSEASLCRYSFSVTSGESTCGFSLAQGAESLATVRATKHEGEVELIGGDTMLVATIDNLAQVFTSVTIACTVTLEPLSQLQAREEHRERVALRAELQTIERQLSAIGSSEKAIAAEEASLMAHLKDLDVQISLAQQKLTANASMLVASERRKLELQAEKEELRVALGSALWALPRGKLDAIAAALSEA